MRALLDDSQFKKALDFLEQKQGDKVVGTCRKLLKKRPKDFDVLHLMGIGYRLQRKFKQALSYYYQALKVRPEGSATLFSNLAFAELEIRRGNIFRADKFAQLARELAAQMPEAYEVSSDVAQRVGDPISAETFIKKALELRPDNPELVVKLAKIYAKANQLDSALATIQHAVQMSPNTYYILMELGEILELRGETEPAVNAFEQARQLVPGNDESIDQKIIGMLSTHGKKDQVVERAMAYIEREPDYRPAHLMLLRVGSYPGGAQAGAEVLESIGGARKKQAQMIQDFALASAFEADKQNALAFGHYRKANDVKHQRTVKTYNIEMTRDHYAKLEQFFTETALEEVFPQNDITKDYPTPVFVLGMPRSGTSLTEQLLGTHSKVHPAGELGFLRPQSYFGRQEFLGHARQYTKVHWDWVRRTYLECIKALDHDKGYVIDKMPHNFEMVGFIRHLFPNAVIIHTFRDPVANCLSIYKSNFGGYHPYGQDLKLLGQYYGEYKKLMTFYADMFGDGIYQSRYEDLVNDPQPVVEKMLSLAGLSWEDQITDFHKSDRIVRTASNDQVRQPIYKTSIKGWKKFEKELQPLIESLLESDAITEADLE